MLRAKRIARMALTGTTKHKLARDDMNSVNASSRSSADEPTLPEGSEILRFSYVDMYHNTEILGDKSWRTLAGWM
jgi:hypothetical protein